MNREQMIEKAAQVLVVEHWPDEYTLADLSPDDRDWVVGMATLVLDAILPQVTTVEDLTRLSLESKVIDQDGAVWEKYRPYSLHPEGWRATRPGWHGQTSERVLRRGPLTVVWTP